MSIDTTQNASTGTETKRDVFTVGEVLSDTFEIKSVIGAGGMGQVFEAHDRGLNRRVAIKAGWPHVVGHPVRKEAQAIAAIRHPSMITVYGLGVHRGIDYVVMERVYGVPLDAHMDKRLKTQVPFTIGETIDLMASIAEGLTAVHRAGVAHRDIKPENIMLAPGNRVILMDFGIVLAEIDSSTRGTMSGSPGYMAPETITDDIDRGSAFLVDMYALGVIGFELLIGELPFDGDTVAEVLAKHIAEPVPDVTALRSDCPAALGKLITELMAKEPTERPSHMETVAWQLRAMSKAIDAPKHETFSVLVVDDDKEIARLMGFWAKKAIPEADVRIAHDAEKALELVHQDPPDVMLLDLHMPKMNGIEVCMYLRGTQLAERTTIVSVSAGAQEHDLQLLHQLGITHFIPKDEGLSKKVIALLKELRRI